jgi:ketosteroid isomerase-like protein
VDHEDRVGLVRRSYELMNRGDYEGLLAEIWDPAITLFDPTRPDPTTDDGTWHGHDGCRRYLADWLDAFEDMPMDPEEFFEAGDGVVTRALVRARARASGIELENRRFHATRFSEGRVVWFGVFEDLEPALIAAAM